jgi:hypothetical protein
MLQPMKAGYVYIMASGRDGTLYMIATAPYLSFPRKRESGFFFLES